MRAAKVVLPEPAVPATSIRCGRRGSASATVRMGTAQQYERGLLAFHPDPAARLSPGGDLDETAAFVAAVRRFRLDRSRGGGVAVALVRSTNHRPEVAGQSDLACEGWSQCFGDVGGAFLVAEQAGALDDREVSVGEGGDHRLGVG